MNASFVQAYRLIGFDNKREALKDTASRLEGGEIGSGNSMVAIFEIIPKDSVGINTVLANVEINYRLPKTITDQKMKYACSSKMINLDSLDISYKKAAAIAMLGMKLKESRYTQKIKWKQIEKFAKITFTTEDFFDKELLSLVSKARKIYSRKRKRAD